MKRYLSLCLLLLVSNLASAAPPYSSTVFIDSDILLADDPSSFIQTVAAGSGTRTMFDRRVNDWVVVEALLFTAYYTDSANIEVQVNPEFDASEAAEKAAFYGHAIGQLPKAMRTDVQTVWLHKGNQAFGGGNNNLLIHTEATGYHGEWLEETLFHESCHTSVDSILAERSDWLSAQTADPEFISTYAQDNPTREDVAESCLLHYAARFRSDRILESELSTINSTIPNRLNVLDTLGITPIVASDQVTYFDDASQNLILPGVKVGNDYFAVAMNLIDAASLRFQLQTADVAVTPGNDVIAEFANGTLSVPTVLAGGKRYAVTMSLVSENPIQFQLTAATDQ